MPVYFFYQIYFCSYLVVSFTGTQHSIRNMFDLGSIGLPRKEGLDTWFLSPYVGKVASSCPVRAFLPLERTSAFMKPTLFINSKKVFSCNAPPMHLNQSSMFFLITSSNSLFRTVSEKAIVPPGLSTLYASLKTASLP